VTLTAEERPHLEQLLAKAKAAARTLAHAHLLLHADQADQAPGATGTEIAEAFAARGRTVGRVRQRFVTEGLEAAPKPKSFPRLPRKVDGDVEAHLVALACSDPPAGRQRGTLRLLADQVVELDLVESLSPEQVRQVLKKTS
jgi:hypothetical protein